MKAIFLVVFAVLATLASGYVVVPESKVKYADKDFLFKQKAIFEVYQHVHQHEVHTALYEDSKNFNVEEHYDYYTNVEAVKEFVYFYKHGMLPFDEVFTIFNDEHREQAIALFNFFYYAKDFDTFYKSFVWARFHVNEGMFVYASTVAILHRPDMKGFILPAVYEIYPYYFFNSDVVQKAQQYKMQGFYGAKKTNDVYSVVIPSNYSSYYLQVNPEQKIAYFSEDVGLNAWYYYFNADYPFWMGGKEFNLYKDRRGEFYMYIHQQYLARYYLERLSNDLGPITEFEYYEPITTGYYPNLQYYNGVAFPARENFYNLYTDYNYHYVEEVYDYERRVRDAIDVGYIVLPDGSHVDLTKPESIEYLGNLIQANPDSVNTRYYKFIAYFASTLFYNKADHFQYHKVIPGVLEQFETSLRDPMFAQIYKRIINFYYQFKDHLPSYTYDEVNFPGFKVESVEMDKLVTYFDKFDSDITNAVDVEVYDEKFTKPTEMKKFGKIAHYQGEDFVIKARQYRLNHMPFTYKVNVNAETATPGVVRVYLGPKYDSYGHVYGVNENRENFFLVDVFKYDFIVGKNVITRDSQQFPFFVKDRTTFFDLYKYVMSAYNGESKFPLDQTESHCAMPARLMLPKGKKGGMPFQFYFIVSPYHAPSTPQFEGYDEILSCGIGSGAKYLDSLPFGYPFDRKINERTWFTPNMYYYDVNIYHKDTEVNAIH